MAKANSSSPAGNRKVRKPMANWLKLSLIAAGMAIPVLVISIILQVKSWERLDVEDEMDDMTSYNVGDIVEQEAPRLNALGSGSILYKEMAADSNYSLSSTVLEEFVQNTNLKSTQGDVVVELDMKKRGLRFEPTFLTEFKAVYVLENTSDSEVAVEFEFPFPENVKNKEINNARLLVDGVEQDKPVRREVVDVIEYDEWGNEIETTYKSGLYWEGKIAANSEAEVEVRYNTVGLSVFSYEGLENPEGSQDFNFEIKVLGSRKFDNQGSLSIDGKEYITEDDKNGIVLTWSKPDLFSKPDVQIEVGTRVNPSRHLFEIYKIMILLYIAFAGVLVIMVTIFKKDFGGVDMMLVAALFAVFFPFLHYLVSFNIDPSADVLSSYAGVVEYSMTLYGAFAIALGVVGGLIIYLISRVSGLKFAIGVGLPLVIIFMGFFPLAMTLPEYKYLLALIGIVCLLAVAVQMRSSRKITRNGKPS